FELRVERRQLSGVQAELGDTALVVDRHRGLVGDGALDVVDGDVVAEHRPRVRVRLLDGRAGEADVRGIRQGIAQVAGEAVGHLANYLRSRSGGRFLTIFIVSRLTVTTRSSSSNGYLGFLIVSTAQSFASLTMPLSASVLIP